MSKHTNTRANKNIKSKNPAVQLFDFSIPSLKNSPFVLCPYSFLYITPFALWYLNAYRDVVPTYTIYK